MAQNEWVESNGNWYYLKADGQYAWQEWIGNYYFNYWGDMAHNSWVESNGNWYYMNQNGVMQTGWQEINGNWYYMNGSGAMATNQWVGDYYMGSNGIMLENTITPDGYLVGYDGKWVKGEQIVFPISESPTNQQNQQTSQQEPVENNHDNKPVKSLEEMEEYLNNNIDQQHINDEFIKLLNEEREAHGITTVTYSPILFKGVDIRSEELEISFSHTRPNGELYYSALPTKESNQFRTMLENATAPIIYLDSDKTLKQVEKEAAKKIFNRWKNSPKHYKAMMVNGDLQAAVSVHFSGNKLFGKQYVIRCYSSLLIGGDAYN
ncbi:Putative cell wall binding repeat-containing protein [Granulicatella balaenopterae]|uniref:Putative cell wall binding repeat-containing protein n=2 Tax=Granulicatella balaenopterae TaxID=137733 RepID=A0A1H9JSM4_9LACT|nr:Putative cell wall binding repeat-containing protein [Granulicatella balaenopterae]